MFLFALFLLACEVEQTESVPGTLEVVDAPDAPDDSVPFGTDPTDDVDDEEEPVDPDPDDEIDDYDGDGYPYSDDCDDDDADVHPGRLDDTCDGVDDDCNGVKDDAVTPDVYEQNGPDGTDLGNVSGEKLEIDAYLNPVDDVDDYYFFVEDGYLDNFGFDLDIAVPGGVDVVAELWFYDEDDGWTAIATIDEGAKGLDESFSYGGSVWSDDEGWYLVRLYSSDGARCDRTYTLTIED